MFVFVMKRVSFHLLSTLTKIMKQHEGLCCLIFSLEIVVIDEAQYFSKLAGNSL